MSASFYEGLSDKSSIRLLTVRSIQNNELHVNLTNVHLDENPDYDCLSYVWGTEILSAKVHNQHGSRAATPALASALTRLFDHGHRRAIWADGICINQSDRSERAQQVEIMRQIFSQAKVMFADLGDAFEGSEEAIDLCEKIVNSNDETSPSAAIFGNSADTFPSVLPPIQHPCWAGFKRIISSDWFTRVWIIQEYLVAKDVQMFCGPRFFDASLIFEAAQYVSARQLLGYDKKVYSNQQARVQYNKASSAASYIQMLRIARSRFWRLGELDLALFLQRGILFGATDPRDRLFAIANLVKLERSLDILPDYTLSSLDVHQRLFRHLSRTDVLLLIELLHSVGEPVTSGQKPSWLPDWTTKSTSRSLELFRSKQLIGPSRHVYRAGVPPGTRHDITARADLSTDMQVLTLRAVVVDSLEYVCFDLFAHLDAALADNDKRASELRNWLSEVHSLAAIAHANEDDVWRTLIANVTNTDRDNIAQTSRVAPSSFVVYFRNFKHYVLALDEPDDSDSVHIEADAAVFLSTMGYVMRGRVFGITKSGRLCLVPATCKRQDSIIVLIGAPVPFAVRSVLGSTQYEMLGHGYVHGIMRGEALESADVEVSMLDFV